MPISGLLTMIDDIRLGFNQLSKIVIQKYLDICRYIYDNIRIFTKK